MRDRILRWIAGILVDITDHMINIRISEEVEAMRAEREED